MKKIGIILFFLLTMAGTAVSAQELPSYYHENGYIESRLKSIPKGKSFIFITDIHQERNAGNATALPAYVMDHSKVGMTVFGGDCFDSGRNPEEAKVKLNRAFTEFEQNLGTRFLWIQGNHDCNSTAVKKYKTTEEAVLIPDPDSYELTIARIAGRVTQDAGMADKIKSCPAEQLPSIEAWSKMHYFYDDAKARIRYIILESGDRGITVRRYLKNDFIKIQTDFLHDCLQSTPKGYDVVIAAHMMVDSRWGANAAYAPWFKEAAEYRKAAKNKVLMICGHSHIDNAFAVTVGQDGKAASQELASGSRVPSDAVLLVAVSCDADASYQKYAKGEGIDLKMSRAYSPMGKNNVNEHCFDVVTFTKKNITCTRIGAGEDRIFLY